jgi:uncharacterized protein
MKFTKHPTTGRNVVRGYSDSTVKIGEREVQGSCAFSATDLIENWPPTHINELTLAHFEPLLAWQPEIILLGTGARQHFPSAQLIASVMARGVGLEVMDTGAACRTFNVLVSEERRVVAALLVSAS